MLASWRFPIAKIITLYKNKGDKGDCNNYRGISLLSVLGKVFSRILLVRLQKLAARVYPESQCGFRSGRSTTDMVFTVRQVQEKCREQNKPLHMAFVDLTKAFNMVSREGLFATLQKLGCPPTLLGWSNRFTRTCQQRFSLKDLLQTASPFPVESSKAAC